MADSNCAVKLLAALMNDGKGQVVSEEEANKGSADPKSDSYYICLDMGTAGIMCIKRPRQPPPVRVQI